MKRRPVIGALVAFAATGLTATAAADPVSRTSGKTVLPLSALVIDLPAKAGVTYKVSASWALSSDNGYDSRDVIDEMSGDNLTVGNWVLTGYFDAGGCDKVLAGEKLDNAWQTTADIWGHSWNVRGGVFTFDGSLGRKPAAIACRDDGDGRSLLLYRFLISQPETIAQDAVMMDLRAAAVPELASRAYDARQIETIAPLRRPEVKNRGAQRAARHVTLAQTHLEFDFPDDGYVWLPHEGDSSDMIDRMAPFFPEVSLEVAAVDGVACDDIFKAASADVEQKPGRVARNLPSGWTAGPAIVVEGKVEALVCRPFAKGALAVGIFLDGERTDTAELHPVLGALAEAKRVP